MSSVNIHTSCSLKTHCSNTLIYYAQLRSQFTVLNAVTLHNKICSYFYRKTNQIHNISNLFYFGTTLCTFQTVSPSIIRSLRLYIYLMLYVQS